MIKTQRIVIFAALTALHTASYAVNLVQNGGFETGNYSPEWHGIPSGGGSGFGVTNEEAFEGQYSMKFYGSQGFDDVIEQSIGVTQGQTYTISMWVKNYGVENDTLALEMDGNTIAYLSPVGTALESWEYLSFTHTMISNNQNFRVRGHDQVAFYVDNISVEAVPEPATMLVLAAGVFGLSRRVRRLQSR